MVADSETIVIFPNQIGKNYMAIRRKFNTFYQYSLGTEGLYTKYAASFFLIFFVLLFSLIVGPIIFASYVKAFGLL